MLTDLRIKVANWVMPERRSCGCAQKPFPMYSMDCPECNPRFGWTPEDLDREFRKNQAEFREQL